MSTPRSLVWDVSLRSTSHTHKRSCVAHTRHTMSQKEHTTAFILRAIPYAERDLIVTLFTREHGLRSAIAKNARSSKRFSGGVQLFRKVDAMLQTRPNKDVDLFLEMRVLEHYPNLENNYDKITIGSYGSELMRELSRGEADSSASFALLEAFYQELNDLGDDSRTLDTILHHFEMLVLKGFGALPSFYQCHRCGKDHTDMERLQCKRTGEGLLCMSCRQPGEAVGLIESDTLEVLHYYGQPRGEMPEAMLMPEVRFQARRVLQNSFRLILQKDLKSRPMLESILN